MIAPGQIPSNFEAWNKQVGAPFGHRFPWRLRRFVPRPIRDRVLGPFGLQENNSIRRFEYPWAFHATPINPGMRVLEIGGGLAGFQFVLARKGCAVVNVDPGLEATGVGWRCDPESMGRLNQTFGTSVELRNTTVDRAALEPNSFDRIFSISVLEHLPPNEIREAANQAYRALKPGGFFIMTVDLFLDLVPFTTREQNEYGTNVNVRELVEYAPFELVQGNRAELYGYPEFDADRVQTGLSRYLLGAYPAMAQCIVLTKRA